MILTRKPREFKAPMLAAKQPSDWTREQYIEAIAEHGILITQPKYDGIRCLIKNGGAVSRKFLDIPNDHIRNTVNFGMLKNGTDGELITYDDITGLKDDFNTIQSKVMTKNGVPKFGYFVFDYAQTDNLDEWFGIRFQETWFKAHKDMCHLWLHNVAYTELCNRVSSVEDILKEEKHYIETGHEGIIFRKLNAKYKCGRSTLDEGHLIALTAWQTSEAKIVGFVEMQHNDNSLGRDAFGRAKRSKSLSSLTPADMLGAIVVEDCKTKQQFKLGSGFTEAQRIFLWKDRDCFEGKIVTYKYKPYGQKDLPRTPIFLGFRLDS